MGGRERERRREEPVKSLKRKASRVASLPLTMHLSLFRIVDRQTNTETDIIGGNELSTLHTGDNTQSVFCSCTFEHWRSQRGA